MLEGLFRDRDNVAHAYAIEGNAEQLLGPLHERINEALDIDTKGNPNVFVKQFTRMGIDDVRALGDLQQKTSVGRDGYKIFIVSFESVTTEAQNAMLKILEEPTPGTVWLLIVEQIHSLLPTVRSRVQVVTVEGSVSLYTDMAHEFVSAGYAEREKLLKRFAADPKKDITADRVGLARFLRAVMSELVEHKQAVPEWTAIYRELEELVDYATDRSSSVKHIGDYAAIRVPQVDSR